jgi:hypothetical protein
MLDYIAEAHRLDLLQQAEEHRLARLARREHPISIPRPHLGLRARIAGWLQSSRTETVEPILSTQEMQAPC